MPEAGNIIWYLLTTAIAILLAIVAWHTTNTLKQIANAIKCPERK